MLVVSDDKADRRKVTLGLRNERWRARLDCVASLYAWIVALGFISIPLAVLTGCLK